MVTDEDVDVFLEHFGIKGMHWGVRKDRGTSSQPAQAKTPFDHTKRNRNLKIAGAVIGAAVITAGAIYVAKHGGVSSFHIGSKETQAGKRFVEKALAPEAPKLTGVVHITGNKFLSDATRRKGGLTDILPEARKAGFANDYGGVDLRPGNMRRYGDRLEKIAVSFLDPQRRTDFANRPIVHQIILPEHHAQGIVNFEQAKSKAWDLVRHEYEKFWQYGLSKTATLSDARRLGLVD